MSNHYKVLFNICGIEIILINFNITRVKLSLKYRQYLTDIGVDTDSILQEIIQWIRETQCSEYRDLVDYAVSERFDDWFPTVRSQTIFLNSYLRSNRHSSSKIDLETGEIK